MGKRTEVKKHIIFVKTVLLKLNRKTFLHTSKRSGLWILILSHTYRSRRDPRHLNERLPEYGHARGRMSYIQGQREMGKIENYNLHKNLKRISCPYSLIVSNLHISIQFNSFLQSRFWPLKKKEKEDKIDITRSI